MTLKTSHCVRVEKPETAFGKSMNDIRAWLDHWKIEPAEFRCVPSGGVVAVDIRFKNEDEAHLFEREFSGSAVPPPAL